MGRHSSDSQWPYLRSVMGWAVPWVLIATAVGVAVWFAVDAVGGDTDPVAETSSETSPTSAPSETSTPTPAPAPEPEPTPAEETPSPGREPLITDGVTVQVLNGTGGIEGAAASMADRLAKLGYEIYAIQTGLTVDQTVVYYTGDEDRRAAEALARRFGWGIAQAPPDLSDEVDVHVVVSAADA